MNAWLAHVVTKQIVQTQMALIFVNVKPDMKEMGWIVQVRPDYQWTFSPEHFELRCSSFYPFSLWSYALYFSSTVILMIPKNLFLNTHQKSKKIIFSFLSTLKRLNNLSGTPLRKKSSPLHNARRIWKSKNISPLKQLSASSRKHKSNLKTLK